MALSLLSIFEQLPRLNDQFNLHRSQKVRSAVNRSIVNCGRKAPAHQPCLMHMADERHMSAAEHPREVMRNGTLVNVRAAGHGEWRKWTINSCARPRVLHHYVD